MYADDLILIAGSISDLQQMINITLQTLSSLDLNISKNKTQYIRVGANFKSKFFSHFIDNEIVYANNNLNYLGMDMESGFKIGINLSTKKSKFYRSFNALYNKMFNADECSITHLTAQICSPILLYGLESLIIPKSKINILKNISNYTIGRIFKSFNSEIINNTLFYLEKLPLHYEYIYRKIKFINKSKTIQHLPFRVLFERNLNNAYNFISTFLNLQNLSDIPIHNLTDLKNYLLNKLVKEAYSGQK